MSGTRKKQNTTHSQDNSLQWLVKQMKGIQDFKMHLLSSTLAPTAACSYFCSVPGRLHSALSYSGTRKSCHYRVGGHRAWGRDRFTLKGIAKEGTFIRREKKRSIKERIIFNFQFRSVKSNSLTKLFANYFGRITKELEKWLQV